MRQLTGKIVVAVGFVLFLAVLSGAFLLSWQANAAPAADGPVEVYFLETQNDAACTLLLQKGAVILIDTGEERDSTAIAAFLQEKGVESIDYLVLTHPDQDHIGGAAYLLEQMEVRYVIQPHYAKENELSAALNAKIDALGIPQIHPSRPRSFTCGEMRMTVYPPLEKHYRKDNNYSLAVWVKHGDVNMAFAGDAEEKRLNEMMKIHWPNVQLYQVAHHGRACRSSGTFIEKLRPQYAVVTASGADDIVKEALAQVGAQIAYTADGTQQFVSNGETLTHLDKEAAP